MISQTAHVILNHGCCSPLGQHDISALPKVDNTAYPSPHTDNTSSTPSTIKDKNCKHVTEICMRSYAALAHLAVAHLVPAHPTGEIRDPAMSAAGQGRTPTADKRWRHHHWWDILLP